MKLLPEFAVLHEVLTQSAGEPFRLAYLRDVILRDSLIRDLRDGGWSNTLLDRPGQVPRQVREIVKTLKKRHRLVPFRKIRTAEPSTGSDWCQEAIESHGKRPLDAIIVPDDIARQFGQTDVLVSEADLPESPLASSGTISVRCLFRMSEYLTHLGSALANARRLCFIDPYIDPSHRDYTEFLRLLLAVGNRSPMPRLEIHRKCMVRPPGSREEQPQTSERYWQDLFSKWGAELARAGLMTKVVIWDDFKTRFFISELLGIHLAKGFKTNRDPSNKNDLSRLSFEDRTDVDLEFDPDASPRHHAHCVFEIGRRRT